MVSKKKFAEKNSSTSAKKNHATTLKMQKKNMLAKGSELGFNRSSKAAKSLGDLDQKKFGHTKVFKTKKKQLMEINKKAKPNRTKQNTKHDIRTQHNFSETTKVSTSHTEHTISPPRAILKKQKKQRKSKHVPHKANHSTAASEPPTPVGAAAPDHLSVPGGFSWEVSSRSGQLMAGPTPASDSSSDDEEEDYKEPASKLSRREVRARAVAEELRLQQRERLLMDPDRLPETADDHERLVVACPDDSSVWIRYMAYFLQATEIEKARAVAKRAVKIINFREEDEKLNVYVAWLNLESMHGTQETLSNVLHEAVQTNDMFKVYTRMAEIHTANNQHDEAEQMYGRLVRKQAANKEAWLRYGVFLMQVGRTDSARVLMQRALRSLDRRDHVEVISKFAQLEFRFGEPERGRTMFDHLLSTYPKRLDQWNVYISQLMKRADHDAAREVFRRAETVRFSARRMRSLLKRHLEFEEAHGSAEQQEAVRETARQFVETDATPPDEL